MNRLITTPRSIGALLGLVAVAFILVSFYSSLLSLPSFSGFFSSSELYASCSPRAYANGVWAERPPHTNKTYMSAPRDALEFAGFGGCASSREFDWHLGSDTEEQWSRFEHPGVMDWEWKVDEEQCAIDPLEGERLLRHLIRDGGWLLLGGQSSLECFHDVVYLFFFTYSYFADDSD